MYINQLRISEQELWDNSSAAVRSYVKRVFPDFFCEADLQDMTSVVAPNAWARADTNDPAKGTVFSWMWKNAKNVVLTNVARLTRERGRFASLDDLQASGCTFDTTLEPAPAADSQLLADELEETFFGHLKSERDRLIFLWLLDGLDRDEIAKRLGGSKQATYMAVHHLRQRLKNIS